MYLSAHGQAIGQCPIRVAGRCLFPKLAWGPFGAHGRRRVGSFPGPPRILFRLGGGVRSGLASSPGRADRKRSLSAAFRLEAKDRRAFFHGAPSINAAGRFLRAGPPRQSPRFLASGRDEPRRDAAGGTRRWWPNNGNFSNDGPTLDANQGGSRKLVDMLTARLAPAKIAKILYPAFAGWRGNLLRGRYGEQDG